MVINYNLIFNYLLCLVQERRSCAYPNRFFFENLIQLEESLYIPSTTDNDNNEEENIVQKLEENQSFPHELLSLHNDQS